MGWRVIGVDPGLDGAIAILTDQGLVFVEPTPVIGRKGKGKRAYDVPGMRAIVESIANDATRNTIAVVEKVGPRPGEGVVSSFGFGFGLGLWHGLLRAYALPLHTPTPQRWKASVLAGTAKDKTAAIVYAQQRWPDVSLRATPRCRTAHDGMADAACLAEYGARLLKGLAT